MMLIAHRGASHDAPENTVAAAQLGWAQGADAVEIDIQSSKDGRIVVFHDDSTRRTAGRRQRIGAQTLAELRALDAGSWKHPKYAGEKIPTLDEVVATIPVGKRLFVEFKCGPEVLPEFAGVLKRAGRSPQQIVPIGFSLTTMAAVKIHLPLLEVCWVAGFKRDWKGRWQPTAAKLIEQAKAFGLDGLDLGAHGPLDAAFVREVHAAGLKLYVWTVDSLAKARALAAAGVDGVTTNKPGWLREQLTHARVPFLSA